MSNLREKYLSVKSKIAGAIDVDGWGKVLIRQLTLADMKSVSGLADVEAVVMGVILGVCDESGKPVFTINDKETLLNDIHYNILNAIAEEVIKLNGLTADKITDAKNS